MFILYIKKIIYFKKNINIFVIYTIPGKAINGCKARMADGLRALLLLERNLS